VLVVALCRVQNAGTEEIEVGAAIHRPLQHFETTDLSFGRTSGPRQFERRADRGEVATKPRREPREQGILRCGEDLTKISGHLAPKKSIQALGPGDSGAERWLVLKEAGSKQVVLGL